MKFLKLFLVFLILAGWHSANFVSAADCVNINTSTKEELEKIKHIGEARAEQIIILREEKLFSSVNDLERVIGIGPSRIADIKEQGVACVKIEKAKAAEDGPPLLLPAVPLAPIPESTSPQTESATDVNSANPFLFATAIFTSFASGGIILILKHVRT